MEIQGKGAINKLDTFLEEAAKEEQEKEEEKGGKKIKTSSFFIRTIHETKAQLPFVSHIKKRIIEQHKNNRNGFCVAVLLLLSISLPPVLLSFPPFL